MTSHVKNSLSPVVNNFPMAVLPHEHAEKKKTRSLSHSLDFPFEKEFSSAVFRTFLASVFIELNDFQHVKVIDRVHIEKFHLEI